MTGGGPAERVPLLRGDAGMVGGIEVLPFGVLIFVVGSLLVANAWAVVDTKFMVTSAAREAAHNLETAIGNSRCRRPAGRGLAA